MLDASCPLTPLLPFLHNATVPVDWEEHWFHQAGTVVVSTTVGIVLLSVATILLIFGARLVKPVFFVSAGLVASAFTFLVTEAMLSAASSTPSSSCWMLMIAPTAVGLLAGSMAVGLLDTAFAAVGLASGAAVGYVSYAVVFHSLPSGVEWLHHDLTYWICVVIAALAGAVIMARLEHTVLIYATSALGGALMIPALAILLLGHVDHRFLWVLEAASRKEHLNSPFVYGQAIGGVVFALMGVFVQQQQHRSRIVRTSDYVAYQQPLMRDGTIVRP